QADGEEQQRHGYANADADVRGLEESPAEAADQINHRIEQRDFLPERRQHADRIKAAAEKSQRRDHEQWHDLQLLEAVRPDADNEAEQTEGHRGEQQEFQHPDRVLDMQRHEQAGGGENDYAHDDRLAGGRADIAEHDLEIGDRRRQQFVDRAGEFREVNSEGCIHDALRQQRQHDQARHDEGAIGYAFDIGDARADGRAEYHEIQRR